MTNDSAWRKRMRKNNPDALRELNRRYYHSPAGQAAVQRKYQKKRDVVIAERAARGNVCMDCAHTDSLQWHHRDPNEKKFAIGMSIIRSYADVYAELAKCDLVCPNCHAKRHNFPTPKGANSGVSRAS